MVSRINLLLLSLTLILLLPTRVLKGGHQGAIGENGPKKIIYETDMCLDVDDVGALASLHALANRCEAEILAVSYNEVHKSAVAAIDAINTWYGRGDIPIGIYRGNLHNPDGSGYLDHVAQFPHDLEDKDAPSSLDLYRQVLSSQPDSSVTIISVGFLNNLNDLVKAEPELVAKKVVELVIMAGVHNDGFNLVRHNLVNASENVLRNWPTPIVISQEGSSIHTGDNLKEAPQENPVREAYYRFFNNRYEGRPSWDQMAVLYGVRGERNYFQRVSSGSGSLSNGYTWQMVPGFRSYLRNRLSNASFERIIKELMDERPIGAYFMVSINSGWIPFTVQLDASFSNVGCRTIEKVLWDFGDGTTGSGITATHEYTIPDSFDIHLTIIDSMGDSIFASNQVVASDPIFSPIEHFGDASNYLRNQPDLWTTRSDDDDMLFYLSNNERNSDIALAGYCFVKDSLYSDFSLEMAARSGEPLSNSHSEFSILFGYKDEKNYNHILFKPSGLRAANVANGQSIMLSWSNQTGIDAEKYQRIKVNLVADHLTVSIDDSVILSASSQRLLKTGAIGFGSAKSAACFDDIAISRLLPSSVALNDIVQQQYYLEQNFPNPFNSSTSISFYLPVASNVKLELYDIIGKKVQTLVDQDMPVGRHKVKFDAIDLPSGIYLCKLEAGEFHEMRRMILLR